MKFAKFCQKLSNQAGSSKTFLTAVSLIAVWALTGPYFHYNDTWQLIINTSTTIITFLMVFLIQHTQNADTAAMQIKLDELIRVTAKANDELLDLEEMDEKRLEQIRKQYEALASKAGETLRARSAQRDGQDAQDDAPEIGGGDDERH